MDFKSTGMNQPKALKKADFLTLLARTKSTKRRKALIDIADRDEILAISECIKNTLMGKVPLSTLQKSKLKSSKLILRKLVGKTSHKGKKEILKKKGGFLGLLLGAAMTALTAAQLASDLKKKK